MVKCLCRGANVDGQCGIDGKGWLFTGPEEVPLPDDLHMSRVAAGSNHSMIVASNGDVYSFGRGSSGELGHCSGHSLSIPTKVSVLTAFFFWFNMAVFGCLGCVKGAACSLANVGLRFLFPVPLPALMAVEANHPSWVA